MKLRLVLLTAACVPMLASADNDFPTLDRVSYVMACMKEHGGQTIENLYACSCRIDALASRMSFQTFNDALTYERYRRMPGEKGGLFRESEQSEQFLTQLDAARTQAARDCPLVKRSGASKAEPAASS